MSIDEAGHAWITEMALGWSNVTLEEAQP